MSGSLGNRLWTAPIASAYALSSGALSGGSAGSLPLAGSAYLAARAAINARSSSEALVRRAEAFCNDSQAALLCSSSIEGLLICGPLHRATPHQAAASLGSRRAASVKDRIASSWLEEKANVSPRSKYFCASSDSVEAFPGG